MRRVLLFLMLTAFGSACEVIEWERKIDEQEKIIVHQKRTIEEFKYLAQVDKKETDDQKKKHRKPSSISTKRTKFEASNSGGSIE